MSTSAKCSFSIEHILNVAGTNVSKPLYESNSYDWLNCTRYRPPRLQRPKKKEGVQRRNPGRNPRIPFSPTQISILESKFQKTPYLSSHEVQELGSTLQLSEVRVKIWFQNRRARERREQEANISQSGAEKARDASPIGSDSYKMPPSSPTVDVCDLSISRDEDSSEDRSSPQSIFESIQQARFLPHFDHRIYSLNNLNWFAHP